MIKRFGLHAMFLLPEDFQGTTSDALRLMADYLEDETVPLPSHNPPPNTEAQLQGWRDNGDQWWDSLMNDETSSRFCGSVGIDFLDENSNAWERQPHGVTNASGVEKDG